jgi:transposase
MRILSVVGELAGLRREIQRGERGVGKRYAPELRRRVTAWAESRHRDGATWEAIAAELGIALNTVRRWCDDVEASSRSLVPVRIQVPAAAARTVTVVSPGGYRVEGLSVTEAAAMLRVLG